MFVALSSAGCHLPGTTSTRDRGVSASRDTTMNRITTAQQRTGTVARAVRRPRLIEAVIFRTAVASTRDARAERRHDVLVQHETRPFAQ